MTITTAQPRPVTHDVIDPAILYFGTPVVLLATVGSDGAPNLAPMSSVFWLGSTAVIGMGGRSLTARNLLATGECVLNLPSADQVDAVDRLALTTGRADVPEGKHAAGYRHVPDKLAHADLTGVSAETVGAPRVAECPVNLEGRVVAHRPLAGTEHDEDPTWIFDVAISRVHVHPEIRAQGHANRIDPDRWRPLLMSFQQFYGLGARVSPSRLATIDEEWYR
ncbi:flavin reductase family protein [Demequina sp. NBRC 110054]|uniref:flavin reductase family protein n=1 Tax=Demequina sp. NBRC 110054 TaxID=1570343 RepID=UPI0009FFC71E|nr:flavin reductase family protein [Demequina sp. NBRC 110054]